MDRFVGWLGRRGVAASALGVAAALAGDALVESRKKNRNGGERNDRDERQDDGERDKQRRARDEKDDRDNRASDDDDGRDRGDRRGSASSEQEADERGNDGDDRADAAQDAPTPTPVPTLPAGVPTTPTPPAVGETNASIEDAQGNVIVGFDPESGSVVARSGNVAAISGPGGPSVIINDDEVVAPVPAEGVTPVPAPDGGDNGTGFES